VDTAKSNVVPTISVEDAEKVKLSANEEPSQDRPTNPPGAEPAGPAPAIPEWYKVGWRAASGIDRSPLEEGEERDRSILDLF
jgi:hypothetical protein